MRKTILAAVLSSVSGVAMALGIVNGFHAGGTLYDAPTELTVGTKCHPSETWPGSKWCYQTSSRNGKFGPYTAYNSVFANPNGVVAYASQVILPAHYNGGDVDREIQNLSSQFGRDPASTLTLDPQFHVHAVMVVWGSISLSPISDEDRAEIAAGGHAASQGFMVDYIANFKKSAASGMPIYRLGGGDGFIWAASWNDQGDGSLISVSADVSLAPFAQPEGSPPIGQNAPPASAPAPAPAPSPQETAAQAAAKADAERDIARKNAAETAERNGKDFLTSHQSIAWTAKLSHDAMADKDDTIASSVQGDSDRGPEASLTAKCIVPGKVGLFSTIVPDGATGSQVVRREVDVRRNDDKTFTMTAATEEGYSNVYDLFDLVPFGQAKTDREVEYPGLWAYRIKFRTTRGDLVLVVPIYDPAIQQVINVCGL
jgi:hypothetical protein